MNRSQPAEVEIEGQRVVQQIAHHPMKKPDIELLKYLSPKGDLEHEAEERLQKFFQNATPYLMSIDDKYIQYQLLNLRMSLREVMKDKMILDNELRKMLFETIRNDWIDGNRDKENAPDFFDKIETEVAQEMAARKSPVIHDILAQSPEKILDECFRQPLSTEELPAEMIEKLVQRRPVLESLMMEAVHEKMYDFMQEVGKVYVTYFTRCNLSAGELGHLSLLVGCLEKKFDYGKYKNFLL